MQRPRPGTPDKAQNIALKLFWIPEGKRYLFPAKELWNPQPLGHTRARFTLGPDIHSSVKGQEGKHFLMD
jgi:hypothetical protein